MRKSCDDVTVKTELQLTEDLCKATADSGLPTQIIQYTSCLHLAEIQTISFKNRSISQVSLLKSSPMNVSVDNYLIFVVGVVISLFLHFYRNQIILKKLLAQDKSQSYT